MAPLSLRRDIAVLGAQDRAGAKIADFIRGQAIRMSPCLGGDAIGEENHSRIRMGNDRVDFRRGLPGVDQNGPGVQAAKRKEINREFNRVF